MSPVLSPRSTSGLTGSYRSTYSTSTIDRPYYNSGSLYSPRVSSYSERYTSRSYTDGDGRRVYSRWAGSESHAPNGATVPVLDGLPLIVAHLKYLYTSQFRVSNKGARKVLGNPLEEKLHNPGCRYGRILYSLILDILQTKFVTLHSFSCS